MISGLVVLLVVLIYLQQFHWKIKTYLNLFKNHKPYSSSSSVAATGTKRPILRSAQ